MKEILLIDSQKTVLSSTCRVHKTESFVFETRNFANCDLFVSRVCGTVVLQQKKFAEHSKKRTTDPARFDCFKLTTEDNDHSFFFAFGSQVKCATNAAPSDIVFFKYLGKEAYVARNHPSLSQLLGQKTFKLSCEQVTFAQNQTDFQKLFRLSYSQSVTFPFLVEEQKKITAIEDQNVLVQGVAGSGKTNICIDKIIYSACQGYAGKILYTTFSRGLLTDTQNKIRHFQSLLKAFVEQYQAGNIVFADSNHRKAVENHLGIYFPAQSSQEIVAKVASVDGFLSDNVDFLMLEDFYTKHISADKRLVGERFFVKEFVTGIRNHQLVSRLNNASNLSHEVIYKEIYGVIFGCFDLENPCDIMPLEDYLERRTNSFTKPECEIIYRLAVEYDAYLKKNNLIDNNLASRQLLENTSAIKKYSLAVIDEVQDLTEVSLCFLRSISRKMFCVGDALQMINPSYFSFAYLKRLLYDKEIARVSELSSNFRNTKKIADIIEKLGDINVKQFGTHSFVLKTTGVESQTPTSLIYVHDSQFASLAAAENFNNYTVIVPSIEQRDALRKIYKNQEILTVAEIKGLEREVVILHNVLSANLEKWKQLERLTVNRKQADENSVYRYYFNLFYVGISRGKTHIFVNENDTVQLFEQFFRDNFVTLSARDAVATLVTTSDKTEAEQDEIVTRVYEFVRLEQFDNARFTADKILSSVEKTLIFNKIDVFENLVSHGKHREAGVRFWELGDVDEARKQFVTADDQMLCNFLDAYTAGDSKGLNIDILDFLPDLSNNQPATNLILDVVKKDFEKLTEQQKSINDQLKKLKKGKK